MGTEKNEFDTQSLRTNIFDEDDDVWADALSTLASVNECDKINYTCLSVQSGIRKLEDHCSYAVVSGLYHDEERMRPIIESTNAITIAVGVRNQYASSLPDGSAVSCLRSSLAFLRSAFLYGINAATSSDAIDGFLLQGSEWTAASTVNDKFRTCDPHELPTLLKASPDGSIPATIVAFSTTYGEIPFYSSDVNYGLTNNQTSAKNFFTTVWKDKQKQLIDRNKTEKGDGSNMLYSLFIVGSIGVGVVTDSKSAYLFDPHGHGSESRAFIVKIDINNLYTYLTSYANPLENPPWSSTFVYFITVLSDEALLSASEETIASAVFRSYGTSDVIFERRSLPALKYQEDKGAFRVERNFEPPERPEFITISRVIVGDDITDVQNDKSEASLHIPLVRGAMESDTHDNNSPSDNTDLTLQNTKHVETEEEMDQWHRAISSSMENTLPHIKENAVLNYDVGPAPPSPPPRLTKTKRHRPTWTPPSSMEDVTTVTGDFFITGYSFRRPRRKYRRKPSYYSGSSEKLILCLSNSLNNLEGVADEMPYIPASQEVELSSPDNTNQSNVCVSDTVNFDVVRLASASDSFKRRKPYNPHVACNVESGPEGLWTDEFLNPYPFDELRDKTRDVMTGFESVTKTTIFVGTGNTNDEHNNSLLGMYANLVFERLIAYIIENGTRTISTVPSIVSEELNVLTENIPLKTAFITLLSVSGMSLADIALNPEMVRQSREEDSRSSRLAFSKLGFVTRDVSNVTRDLHASLDSVEADISTTSVRSEDEENFAYNRFSSTLIDIISSRTGPGQLYYEKLPYNTNMESLSERVTRISKTIRTYEEQSRYDAEVINLQLQGIESGIQYMRRNMDSFVIGGEHNTHLDRRYMINLGQQRPSATALSSALTNITQTAITVIGDAIREYYFSVAKHSVNVFNLGGRLGRYALVNSPKLESLYRMASSLPVLDTALLAVAELRSGTQRPPSIVKSSIGTMFLGLIDIGKDLSSDERLTAWISLFTHAHSEQLLERKELEMLIYDINKINEKAKTIKVADDTALQKFLDALDRATKYYAAENTIDEKAMSELIRHLETAMAAYDTLKLTNLESAKINVSLADDVNSRLQRVKKKSEELKEVLTRGRAITSHVLRPLKDFIGIRDITKRALEVLSIFSTYLTSSTILTTLNESNIFNIIIQASPPEILGQLRSDFITLLSQYRSVIERPNQHTLSTLEGLGTAFALAIQWLFNNDKDYPEAMIYFSKYADIVAKSLLIIHNNSRSPTELRSLALLLNDAWDEIGRVSISRAQNYDIGVADSTTTFDYLRLLSRKYELAAEEAERNATIATLTKDLQFVSDSSVRLLKEIKTSKKWQSLRDGLEEEITSINSKYNSIVEDSRTFSTITASLTSSVEALTKLISTTNGRLLELNSAVKVHQEEVQESRSKRAEEEWHISSSEVLDIIDEKTIFDPTAISKLAETGTAEGFSQTTKTRKRAVQILNDRRLIVLQAIEAVLKFNPYDPENYNASALAPISLLKDLTWGDSFIASSSAFSVLFGGVDVQPLIETLGAANVVLAYTSKYMSGNDPYDYRTMISMLERYSQWLPFLHKYSNFYQRGREAYELLISRLTSIRTTVSHASGRLPIEINMAISEMAAIRGSEEARAILAAGVSIAVPSVHDLEQAVDVLEKENHDEYVGTAYEKAADVFISKELAAARAAVKHAKKSLDIASERSVAILKEVASAADALDKASAEGLANLKNLLRLVPPPKSAAKALDMASSVDDIVTQMGILLTNTEQARELDIVTVDWLHHARTVIDSHPVSVLIDETGPATKYAERIEELTKLRTDLESLRSSIAVAENKWEEAWVSFKGNTDKINKSYDGMMLTEQTTCRLEAAGNIVLALRTHETYGRLPEDIITRLETKRSERELAIRNIRDILDNISANGRRLESLLKLVPNVYAVSELKSISKQIDDLLSTLPKWYNTSAARYRTLIDLRLGMYAAYYAQRKQYIGENICTRPELFINPTDTQNKWNVISRAKARVAAWMGSKAVATLREAISSIDYHNQPTYLDANGMPLRYLICYQGVIDKIGAVLCDSDLAREALPPLTQEPTMYKTTDAAASILSELLGFRLEYTQAALNGFEDYARYVRLKRSSWDLNNVRRALTETYAALLSTTVTRTENAKWSSIYIFPALLHNKTALDHSWISADAKKVRIGREMSSAREIQIDIGDLITIINSWAPAHIVAFSKLDFMRQHEFMAETLYCILSEAMSKSFLINCLEIKKDDNVIWRPLSLEGSRYDPSSGSLFSIIYGDWETGRLSQYDPLVIWEQVQGEVSVGLANIKEVLRSVNRLTALTVLARACIPQKALSAMWTAMRPDSSDLPVNTFDELLNLRSCISSHLTVTESINSEILSTVSESEPLYHLTGKISTFTITSSPPTAAMSVNAIDIVIAATLFGARLVVAAECPGAYSNESGISLCIKLFDSRKGAESVYMDPSVVSTDLVSWGKGLLEADNNVVENACLFGQLEELSALLASKPLVESPPCLVIVDEGMKIKRVLWAKTIPTSLGILHLNSDSNIFLDELPYISDPVIDADGGLQDKYNYYELMNADETISIMLQGNQGYPTPVYNRRSTLNTPQSLDFPPLPKSPILENRTVDALTKQLLNDSNEFNKNYDGLEIRKYAKKYNDYKAAINTKCIDVQDCLKGTECLSQLCRNEYSDLDNYSKLRPEDIALPEDEYIDDSLSDVSSSSLWANALLEENVISDNSGIEKVTVNGISGKLIATEPPARAVIDFKDYVFVPDEESSLELLVQSKSLDLNKRPNYSDESPTNVHLSYRDRKVYSPSESFTDVLDNTTVNRVEGYPRPSHSSLPISTQLDPREFNKLLRVEKDKVLGKFGKIRKGLHDKDAISDVDLESLKIAPSQSKGIKCIISSTKTDDGISSDELSDNSTSSDELALLTSTRRQSTKSKVKETPIAEISPNKNERVAIRDYRDKSLSDNESSEPDISVNRAESDDDVGSDYSFEARTKSRILPTLSKNVVSHELSDSIFDAREERRLRLQGYVEDDDTESEDDKTIFERIREKRLIPSDDLLLRGRREFRTASRGAMYYLMKACKEIALRIQHIRKDLIRSSLNISAELAKIRMLLLSGTGV